MKTRSFKPSFFARVIFVTLVIIFTLNTPASIISYAGTVKPEEINASEMICIYSQDNFENYDLLWEKNGKFFGDLGGWGCGAMAVCHAAQWLGYVDTDTEVKGVVNLPVYLYDKLEERSCDNMNDCVKKAVDEFGLKESDSKNLKTTLDHGGAVILNLSWNSGDFVYDKKNNKYTLSGGGHYIVAVGLSSDGKYVRIIDSCLRVMQGHSSDFPAIYKYKSGVGFVKATAEECAVKVGEDWGHGKGNSSKLASNTSSYLEVWQEPGKRTIGGGDYWIRLDDILNGKIVQKEDPYGVKHDYKVYKYSARYFFEKADSPTFALPRNVYNYTDEEYIINSCSVLPQYADITVYAYAENAAVKSLPLSNDGAAKLGLQSKTIEPAKAKTYTATALIRNSFSNWWYQVKTSDGTTGYVYSGDLYSEKNLFGIRRDSKCGIKPRYDDVHLSGNEEPGTIKSGTTFQPKGLITADYNFINAVSIYAYVDSLIIDGNPKKKEIFSCNFATNAVRLQTLTDPFPVSGFGYYGRYCIDVEILSAVPQENGSLAYEHHIVNLCSSRYDVVSYELSPNYYDVESCSCNDAYEGMYICTAPNNLVIHSDHSWDSSTQIGLLQKGEVCKVTKSDGKYAHIQYGNMSGICAMSYLKKASTTSSDCGCTDTSVAGLYFCTSSTNLVLHSDHSYNDSSAIGQLPGGEVCVVTKKSPSKTFTHVIYKGIEAICSSNYLRRVDSWEIEIESLPYTTSYELGQQFDPTGLVLELSYYYTTGKNYTSGTELITDHYTITGYDASTPGKQNVTVNYAGKTVSFAVTVKPAVVHVSGITAAKTMSLNIFETKSLVHTITPSSATNKKVTFASSDSAIALVDESGAVTGLKAGKATITVTTEDGKYSSSCAVTVSCSHSNIKVLSGIAPTCSETGITDGKICSDCGAVIVTQQEIKPLGHSFGAWMIFKEPSFSQDGETRCYCSRCGSYDSRSIPKLSESHSHDFSGTEETDTAPTCTKDGVKRIFCSTPECSQSVLSVIPAYGHDYGKWEITKDATFSRDGERTRRCVRCGAAETARIPRLSDTHIHSFTGTETVERTPTCLECGEKRIYCCERECKEYITESIQPLGHSESNWTIELQATCKSSGTEVKRCTRCGNALQSRAVESHGHSWNTGIITKDATLSAPGIITYTCISCGTERTETIPVLPAEVPVTSPQTAPPITSAAEAGSDDESGVMDQPTEADSGTRESEQTSLPFSYDVSDNGPDPAETADRKSSPADVNRGSDEITGEITSSSETESASAYAPEETAACLPGAETINDETDSSGNSPVTAFGSGWLDQILARYSVIIILILILILAILLPVAILITFRK